MNTVVIRVDSDGDNTMTEEWCEGCKDSDSSWCHVREAHYSDSNFTFGDTEEEETICIEANPTWTKWSDGYYHMGTEGNVVICEAEDPPTPDVVPAIPDETMRSRLAAGDDKAWEEYKKSLGQ